VSLTVSLTCIVACATTSPRCFHNGAAVKTVQLALGHSTPMITLSTYAHEWPDALDRTRTLVDTALGAPSNTVGAGQRQVLRYRPRLEMYCTTPSGTRYQMG